MSHYMFKCKKSKRKKNFNYIFLICLIDTLIGQYYDFAYIAHSTADCTVHSIHGTAQSAHRPQHCTWAHPDFHKAISLVPAWPNTNLSTLTFNVYAHTHYIFYFIFLCKILFYQLLEVIKLINNLIYIISTYLYYSDIN